MEESLEVHVGVKGCGEEGLVKDLRVFTVECEEVVVGEPTHFHREVSSV